MLAMQQKIAAMAASLFGTPTTYSDQGGGDTINLTTSQISSNINLSPIGFASLSSMYAQTHAARPAATASAAAWSAYTIAAHGDVVSLNPTGTGVAHIATSDASGYSSISGFKLGRDFLDMALTAKSGAAYALHDFTVGGVSAVAITDAGKAAAGNAGTVLIGQTSAGLASHLSTASVGGVTHLYIH